MCHRIIIHRKNYFSALVGRKWVIFFHKFEPYWELNFSFFEKCIAVHRCTVKCIWLYLPKYGLAEQSILYQIKAFLESSHFLLSNALWFDAEKVRCKALELNLYTSEPTVQCLSLSILVKIRRFKSSSCPLWYLLSPLKAPYPGKQFIFSPCRIHFVHNWFFVFLICSLSFWLLATFANCFYLGSQQALIKLIWCPTKDLNCIISS